MTEHTSNQNTIALVTGANKGIGHAIAAGLGALGWSVGVGARDERRRAAAVDRLRTAGIDAFGVPLDVTDDASALAAARLIEERTGRLDVLINNAGVTGGMPQQPTRVSPEQVRSVVETNVIGVMRVSNAMLPLLHRSAAPRIVNMSSGVGSLSRQSASTDESATGPISGAYTPSKTYLNAVTVQYAKELQDTKILINLACPGFVATDLNGFRGVRSPNKAPRSRSSSPPCPTTDPPAATSKTPESSRGETRRADGEMTPCSDEAVPPLTRTIDPPKPRTAHNR